MTVYADMVFMVNFIMDSFVLWAVSKFGRKKIKPHRLAAGGLLMSAMYCLLLFTEAFRYARPAAASVLILGAGVASALRPPNIKTFLKMLLAGYVIAFTAAGLGFGLFYLTDLPYIAYYLAARPVDIAGGVSPALLAASAAVMYILIKLGAYLIRRVTVKKQLLCPVRVCIGESEAAFDVLVDTGHSLREPVSRSPVIVAEFEQVKLFLPDALRLMFYENHENDFAPLFDKFDKSDMFGQSGDTETAFCSRVRVLPFSGVGEARGILLGFRPDRVSVSQNQRETVITDAVIGVCNSRLCRDGRYHGLISPELLIG